MSRFLAAAVQMTSGSDKQANLRQAIELVEEAARRGAQFVALPELFNCLTTPAEIVHQAEPIPGPTSTAMGQLAARLGITLLAGSIAERNEPAEKVFNTSLLFSPEGRQLASYRKIHLFGIDLPGQLTFQESDFVLPGDCLRVTPTEVARVGQATCFDLRFPELFRQLTHAGAQVFCTPSAFTLETGRDHWEMLIRVRALENQVFVIAANQYGRHTPTLRTFGRSMIADPWGIPLAIAADGPAVVVAEINLECIDEVRSRIPMDFRPWNREYRMIEEAD